MPSRPGRRRHESNDRNSNATLEIEFSDGLNSVTVISVTVAVTVTPADCVGPTSCGKPGHRQCSRPLLHSAAAAREPPVHRPPPRPAPPPRLGSLAALRPRPPPRPTPTAPPEPTRHGNPPPCPSSAARLSSTLEPFYSREQKDRTARAGPQRHISLFPRRPSRPPPYRARQPGPARAVAEADKL